MKLSTEKILLAGISIALVALGALVFNAFKLGHKVNDTSYQLEQNRKLINHSESLLLATVNNQSGVRGYVITGNEEFLEPHNKSLPELEKELTALKKLIAQKPALQHYLDSLVFYVQKGIAISDKMITLRRQPGEGEASKLFYTGEGKRYADQIRNFVAILQQNENAELQRSQTKNERAVKNLQKSFAWISAVIVSIVILYVLKVRYDISYHKKTEKKLKNFNAELEQQVKEKTEEIKNVFERIADGFIAVDRNWHYVYGNDKGGELIFRDPRDLIGKNVWEEFPEAKEKFYPVFNRAMETQQYQYLEQYYPPFDRWFEIHLYPSIDGLSIYFKDITGKKKVEAEKRRLAEIIEASTDFVGIAGKDQRMEYMNKAGLQSLKYSSIEEMASKSLVHFLPERFRDSFQNEAVPFIQKYGGWNGETYWMANDGCEIPISVVVLAHKNLKGEIEYYSSVARDITERKKAEGKIKKEKQLSDTLINSLPGVFYLFDDTGKFIRWNKNFETISGYSEEEVRQMHPLEFFDANEKGLIAERIGKVFTDGASDAEASFLTKDGEKIPYFFTGLQLMYEDKKCLLGCGIDLSALKNLERELADEKIAQQKRIMQAMLEAQEAEKNNLGRELHDNINQTLVVVKIYLDIMAGNEQPERVTIAETKKLLENAMKEIRNLSHSLAVNYEFDQGLRVALQYLGDEIQKTKELDIELECDDAIEGLTTSEMKLAIFRIVQEQLSNIIKHAAAKKTLIHLFPENGEMVLRIQDDGNGFDLSKVKKGIGLNNIVLRAETLGGEARIQSSPGKGCRIEIKLPLSQML